jgi:hypothetical protein
MATFWNKTQYFMNNNVAVKTLGRNNFNIFQFFKNLSTLTLTGSPVLVHAAPYYRSVHECRPGRVMRLRFPIQSNTRVLAYILPICVASSSQPVPTVLSMYGGINVTKCATFQVNRSRWFCFVCACTRSLQVSVGTRCRP